MIQTTSVLNSRPTPNGYTIISSHFLSYKSKIINITCSTCYVTFTYQGSTDTSSYLSSVAICPNCSTRWNQCNYCSQAWILKTRKKQIEAHAEKHYYEEQQSSLDGSNQSSFMDHPPIILDSLETGDNTLNPEPIDLLHVENNDHNYGNTLDKDDDEIDLFQTSLNWIFHLFYVQFY